MARLNMTFDTRTNKYRLTDLDGPKRRKLIHQGRVDTAIGALRLFAQYIVAFKQREKR